MECYLDNAATTRPFSEVCDLVTRVMYEDFGNPSSLHMKGVIAERYVRQAREQIAKTLKCAAKNIVFTSGGTESNNMALIGSALANARAGKHIITTCFEHAAVYEPLLYLEKMGYEVTYLPVDSMGHVSEETLENALRKDTILVSTMLVNNEVGAILDVEKFSKIVKAFNKDIIFHVDAIQAYGKMNIYPKRMGIDLLSVSGHKIHGPKGTGFLYVGDKVKIHPYIHGGGQQQGMRSGFPNCDMGTCVAVGRIAICHKNIPNMISQFTKILGAEGLNIADMTNKSKGEYAYTLIDLESAASREALDELKAIEGVSRVRVVK